MKNRVTTSRRIAACLAAGLATALTAVGCSSGDAGEAAPSDGKAARALAAPATSSSIDQLCRSLMQRQRACGNTFIPALVAARVENDNPAGIAARDRAVGRAALLEEAFSEWASDSLDPAIDLRCDQLAQAIAPSREPELRDLGGACLAISECDAFVACAVPLNLGRWQE
jgi:hypothetical protein